MRLDGKTALVTGGSSGIGREVALELVRRGVGVIVAGRSAERLAETVAKAPAGRVVTFAGDLARPADRAALVAHVRRQTGRLDILVNNAGTLAAKPLAATSDAEIEAMLRINLAVPFALVRDLLPQLRLAAQPMVVNVGSMFGEIAFPLFAAYSASKFGLRGLSDALRRELLPQGIHVLHAAPRATRTGLSASFERLVEPFAMKLDEADVVARRIVDGIERGAIRLYPGPAERVFALVQAVLPRVIDRGLAPQLRKALPRVAAEPMPSPLQVNTPTG